MSQENLFLIFNIIAIINVAIICSFLCLRKKNSLPNYVLSIVFFIPGLYFVDNLFVVSGNIQNWYGFYFFVQIIANLFPLAVYYYVHLLLTDNKKFHPVLLTGTILLTLFSFVLPVLFHLKPENDKIEFLIGLNSENYPIEMTLYNILFYVWQMVYLIVLINEIKTYQTLIKNNLSSVESTKLHFSKQFIWLIGFLNLSLVVFYLFLPIPIVDYGILPTIVTLIYFFIIYFSVKNNAIFNERSYSELVHVNEELISKINLSGNENSSLPNEKEIKFNAVVLKIEKALIENKLYLNKEFKLSHLSDFIQEQPYYTSQVLNKHFNKSFFDIINELRVKEAEVKLQQFDAKKDKIENIAYDVGFNSRASFYRSFKKLTGKNPSDIVSSS